MASTDSGPLGYMTFISYDMVDPNGTGELWIRIRYSLDTTSATEALTRFLVWHDDQTGSTSPVWVDASDADKAGGGDDGTPTIYEVITPVPLSTSHSTWWETFEEYPLGTAGTLSYGGTIWNGGAELVAAYVGTVAREDFESYPPGTAGTMDGGTGWDGDGAFVTL